MPAPETLALGAVLPPIPSGPTPLATLISIVALLLVFGLPPIIVFIVLRHKANRARMLQETILKLAEKASPFRNGSSKATSEIPTTIAGRKNRLCTRASFLRR